MDKEVKWIEDGENDVDVEEDQAANTDLFAERVSEFELRFGDGNITLNVNGIKSKYPQFLQSTGLTLWKSSEILCSYLCDHPEIVQNKSVVELGAGLGCAGIIGHKLGASKVVLTDGDTETLENMRHNVAANVKQEVREEQTDNETIICKQLIWGNNMEAFMDNHAPSDGFDVVMVRY
mmetsp:Transcript_24145/g.27569  ORF Transcript_24145/g.27569 Transcript_24145/m.27569 type:complete len:178 (-) Transcript_24145:395-928(-)